MIRGLRRLAPSSTPRRLKVAAVAAPLATIAVVGVGVAATQVGPGVPVSQAGSNLSAATTSAQASPTATAAEARSLSSSALAGVDRSSRVTRDLDRLAVPAVTGSRWTTEALDLRFTPTENARTNGTVEAIKKISISGVEQGAYAQVVFEGRPYWVTKKYLAAKKPKPAPSQMGLSDAPCPDGSAIEGALQPQSVKVYRAVCAAFPELTTYGGQDGHGEHVNGEAIDFMVPSHDVGERVKDFLYAHHSELDLFDIIWEQHIWTIERSSEGFRSMSDRGSATANHFDHVHIKIN